MSEALHDHIEVISGVHIPAQLANMDGKGVPYLTGPADFIAGRAVATRFTAHPQVMCKPGDILLTVKGSGAGRLAVSTTHACISRQLAALRATRGDIDFWRHYLESKFDELSARASSGLIPGLTRSDILSLPAPDVKPPEQRKIAEILDTVDESIRSTERLISKQSTARAGLLDNLMERATASPSSKIELLDEVAKRGSGHTPSKDNPSYWNGGIKWVSLADSSKLDKLYIWNTDKEISTLGIDNSSAVLHPAGTVILTRDAGVGKSSILAKPMAVSQHFMAWQCRPTLINIYLYYWLQHRKPRFEAIAMGSTIKTIGLSYFKKLKITVPSLDFQATTANTMLEIENTIEQFHIELSKQRALKQGLMEDLLTGRVRVKVS